MVALGAALLVLPMAAGTAHASPTATSGDGKPLALTPPMGWNDWAHYGCGVTEQIVTANADALVSSGLAVKGYNTVTVDDCWMSKSRDVSGNLVADPVKFPHGMAWLGSYLHARGLKFGIYEDAGWATCEGYPGSGRPKGGGADHFAQDAASFASWGVDYLKLDGCNMPSGEQAYRQAYDAQAAALRGSGRDIVFSESAPAYFQTGEWGNPTWFDILSWTGSDGQLWREGADIAMYNPSQPNASRWGSVLGNYGYNRWIGRYASPGNWNDPDFLIAGAGGLTDDESRSQVALWSMMAAPMILSSDVGHLTSAARSALGNTDLIALDQDALGRQAGVVSTDGSTDVLARPLANGDRAVAVLNRGSAARSITTALGDVGLPGCTVTAKDLWTGKPTAVSSGGALKATVPGHGTAIWRLTPGAGCGAALPTGQLTGNGAKCADVTGGGTADGTAVILYTCSGNANQRWTINPDHTLHSLGKCLTENGTTVGSSAVLSTCTGAATQSWTAQPDGTLVNSASGLCLDVYGTADATKLDTWTCGHLQANQVWALPN